MVDQKKEGRLIRLLQNAAARATLEEDPWRMHEIESIPAERVVRHLFNPESSSWTTDETIVKVEKTPFTHGAMRFCFRMKKRAQPPADATNHRFHRLGWRYASNYIAKCYIKNGEIDTSDSAKRCVENDVKLQYEANHWAQKFNGMSPPSKIHFIRAYAIEFPDRPGRPWMAVERFIAGSDSYGVGFTKHNTNAGFVDTELRRVTPQLFSAYSFYASHGQRLVADIQGVGNLYTDPQVLSNDYRFGDGDLGPRGMALFFHGFRSSGASDAMGIPLFPLSKNELKKQTKYDDDEVTLSDDDESNAGVSLNDFQALDLNRKRRSTVLQRPRDLLPMNKQATSRMSNLSRSTKEMMTTASTRRNSKKTAVFVPSSLQQHHQSEADSSEIRSWLERAQTDRVFTHHDFHRLASGGLRERQYKDGKSDMFHRSNVVRSVSAPVCITDETRMNLGRVHYQLSVLHGSGRFPEVVPNDNQSPAKDLPSHDAFSVLFHLSYGASLHNSPSCLALARVQAGFESIVSDLLSTTVSTNFEGAKTLLRRTMLSPFPPTKPKASAGCLLFQILQDEQHVDESETHRAAINLEMMQVLDDTLSFLALLESETAIVKAHQVACKRGGVLHVGDRVEADYAQEGTYYSASVSTVACTEGCGDITVVYDDDGSSETLPRDKVRLLIPLTATQTSLGGPLSDQQAFGSCEGDDDFIFARYEMQFELAKLHESYGDVETAVLLYDEAAEAAMADGKMKTANEWSSKAAALR